MAYGYGSVLRDRVIRAVKAGSSARSAAARFDVGVATAIRWVRLWRKTGSPMDAPRRRRGTKLDAHFKWLVALRGQDPDMTLQAMADKLHEDRGVRVDKGRLSRFFKRHGITFKKKPFRH